MLSVAHSEYKLSWRLGWVGEKSYASGAFIGCGLADRLFEHPARPCRVGGR